MHTEINRQPAAKIGSERAFGIVFAVVFLLVALWPLLDRAPLNRLWFRFGELLHRIVSPIALGVIFFGVVTPYAVVMRLFGRDALLLRKGSARPSYWVRREPPGPPPDSFHNQFWACSRSSGRCGLSCASARSSGCCRCCW